ncbi:MAG: hypothetical protein WBQ03_15140, partial [Candidatus Sulfotelmatobacter sp.]
LPGSIEPSLLSNQSLSLRFSERQGGDSELPFSFPYFGIAQEFVAVKKSSVSLRRMIERAVVARTFSG